MQDDKVEVQKRYNPVVKKKYNPPLQSMISDQFAFTSAAITSIIPQIQRLLETNEYVSIISLDFSKAYTLPFLTKSSLLISQMKSITG